MEKWLRNNKLMLEQQEEEMNTHNPNEAIRIATEEPVAKNDYKTMDRNWFDPQIPKGPTKKEFIKNTIDKKLHILNVKAFTLEQKKAISNFVKEVIEVII